MDKVLLAALKSYFRAERIVYDARELELQLFSHPHAPSLYAVTETLHFLNIDNVAARIAPDQLDQLPEHFLAFIEESPDRQYFAHVEQSGEEIHLRNRAKVWTKAAFLANWQGVVLLAEAEEKPPATGRKLAAWWLPALLSALAIVWLWQAPLALGFVLLGLAACFLSAVIHNTSRDQATALGQMICGQETAQSGCARVLKASGYQLGPFALNDLLFAFVSAGSLLVLWLGQLTVVFMLLYALAGIAIVTTLVLQAFVLRSWCRLCLLSSGIMLLQAVLVAFALLPLAQLPAPSEVLPQLLTVGLLFAVSLLLIFQYRQLVAQKDELQQSQVDLLAFKRSAKVIKLMLGAAQTLDQPAGAPVLQFGNPEAADRILVVLSATCHYCQKAYLRFYEFYQKHRDAYRFELLFNHFDAGESDPNRVAASLLRRYRQEGPEAFLAHTRDWYQEQDLGAFRRKPGPAPGDADHALLQEQRAWCVANELFHTPILLINDLIMPHQYDTTYLEDLMEALQEEEED